MAAELISLTIHEVFYDLYGSSTKYLQIDIKNLAALDQRTRLFAKRLGDDGLELFYDRRT